MKIIFVFIAYIALLFGANWALVTISDLPHLRITFQFIVFSSLLYLLLKIFTKTTTPWLTLLFGNIIFTAISFSTLLMSLALFSQTSSSKEKSLLSESSKQVLNIYSIFYHAANNDFDSVASAVKYDLEFALKYDDKVVKIKNRIAQMALNGAYEVAGSEDENIQSMARSIFFKKELCLGKLNSLAISNKYLKYFIEHDELSITAKNKIRRSSRNYYSKKLKETKEYCASVGIKDLKTPDLSKIKPL